MKVLFKIILIYLTAEESKEIPVEILLIWKSHQVLLLRKTVFMDKYLDMILSYFTGIIFRF